MSDEKMIQVSSEKLYILDTALNSIYELAASLYSGTLGIKPEYIFTDKTSIGRDKFERAYFWINDSLAVIDSAVLAIRTISELAQNNFPDYY